MASFTLNFFLELPQATQLTGWEEGLSNQEKKCRFVRLLSSIAANFVGKREILMKGHC